MDETPWTLVDKFITREHDVSFRIKKKSGEREEKRIGEKMDKENGGGSCKGVREKHRRETKG